MREKTTEVSSQDGKAPRAKKNDIQGSGEDGRQVKNQETRANEHFRAKKTKMPESRRGDNPSSVSRVVNGGSNENKQPDPEKEKIGLLDQAHLNTFPF